MDQIIEIFGVLFVLYLIIKYGVRAGMGGSDSKENEVPTKSTKGSDWLRGMASLVEPQIRPASPASTDGLQEYDVQGVDRKTKADVYETIRAASAENAKVKAELNGIVVTKVTRR